MVRILKIGGSILTDKSKPSCPRSMEIARIAEEIAAAPSDLVLVHGAGSFGHVPAKKYGLPDVFSPEGLRITHGSVLRLNDLIVTALGRAGAMSLPVNPLGCTLLEDGRICHMDLEPLKEMLRRGIVPVLHGDVAMDITRGSGIVSGDQLVSHIAVALKADLAAIGTNVDGVLQGGVPADVVTRSDLSCLDFGPGSGVDVTGGMKGKLLELLDLADMGIESQIFNAGAQGMVQRALQGEHVGTVIRRSK
jgi:isopentenyl phosphate kinase